MIIGFFLVSAQKLPKNYHFEQLENGLSVLLIENENTPLVHVNVTVRAGANVEDPANDGINFLYRHAFFQTNEYYASEDTVQKFYAKNGVVKNATSDIDALQFEMTNLAKFLDETVDFLAATLRFPLPNSQQLADFKKIVASEHQSIEMNPVYFLEKTVYKKLWNENYSRKNVFGDFQSIYNFDWQRILDFREKYFVPNNVLITIAGDIEMDEALNLVYSKFETWKGTEKNPVDGLQIPVFIPLTDTVFASVVNEHAANPAIFMAWQGPGFKDDPQFTVVASVFEILMSLKNARFQQLIVHSGLAKLAKFSFDLNHEKSNITLYVLPEPKFFEQCYKKVLDELSIMDDALYFSDLEIETAIRKMEINQVYDAENLSAHITKLSKFWASSNLGFYFSLVNYSKQVKREDLRMFVKKYLKGQSFVFGNLLSTQLKNKFEIPVFVDKIDTNVVDTLKVVQNNNNTVKFPNLSSFKVHFDFDKAFSKNPDNVKILDKVGKLLESDSLITIYIDGHTDDRGNGNYNLKLSKRRAEFVKQLLLKKYPKVKPQQLVVRGFGEKMPLMKGMSTKARSKNRRVEFNYYDQKLQKMQKEGSDEK